MENPIFILWKLLLKVYRIQNIFEVRQSDFEYPTNKINQGVVKTQVFQNCRRRRTTGFEIQGNMQCCFCKLKGPS